MKDELTKKDFILISIGILSIIICIVVYNFINYKPSDDDVVEPVPTISSTEPALEKFAETKQTYLTNYLNSKSPSDTIIYSVSGNEVYIYYYISSLSSGDLQILHDHCNADYIDFKSSVKSLYNSFVEELRCNGFDCPVSFIYRLSDGSIAFNFKSDGFSFCPFEI